MSTWAVGCGTSGPGPCSGATSCTGSVEGAHPDDRVRLRQSMEDAVRSGRPFEQEYRVVRPDGSERRIYLRAEPTVSSAGLVVGLRGIGQDLTDDPITRDRPAT